MQTLTTTTERYLTAFDRIERDTDAPDWLRTLRRAGMDRFAETGFPTTRQEEWRFTSVKGIAELSFATAAVADPTAEQIASFCTPGAPARAVFVNGVFSKTLSILDGLPPEVTVGSLAAHTPRSAALEEALGARARLDNPFTALNTAFLHDGAFVHVPAGVHVEPAIDLLFVTVTDEGDVVVAHPRNLVVVEDGASVRLIESFAGIGAGRYLTNVVTEIDLGNNARAECFRVQRESARAYHVAATNSRQGRDSRYALHPVVLGAALARHDIWMKMDGENGEGVLNGLYLTGGTQHVDHNTVIEHAQAHCESHEYFNGILADRSHAVFNGRIIVQQGAQKTDSKQTNNNLLLSNDARADSQPQLEIYADDVRCTHGATLGPLDDTAMFYLQSRGLDAMTARAMLTYGFGVEILNRVEFPELRTRLDGLVKDWLNAHNARQAAA